MGNYVYCFPPFSLLGRVLKKLCQEQGPSAPTAQTRPGTSHASQAPPNRLPCVRRAFIDQDLSSDVTDILMSSWTLGTQTQYLTSIKRWEQFCISRQIDPVSPLISQVLDFLMYL